jgi:hypothetical protein
MTSLRKKTRRIRDAAFHQTKRVSVSRIHATNREFSEVVVLGSACLSVSSDPGYGNLPKEDVLRQIQKLQISICLGIKMERKLRIIQ